VLAIIARFAAPYLTKMVVPQDRVEDMRRWICFLIRHHERQRAAVMYDQIVSLNIATIKEDIDVVVCLNKHAEVASLCERLERYQRAQQDELDIKGHE